MPERTRKRVLRRSHHRSSVTGDSQAVMQRLVEETNDILLKMAELDEEMERHTGELKKVTTGVPNALVLAGEDIKAKFQRLDEAVIFLLQIAGLDDQTVQKVNTKQNVRIGNGHSEIRDTVAHTHRDDDKLWEEQTSISRRKEMPERTRKRVFRRSHYRSSVTGDSQAVLQKLVEEANDYLLKTAELDKELERHNEEVKKVTTEVPTKQILAGEDIKVNLQRLDEAVAFMQQIAGLDEQTGQELENTPQNARVGNGHSEIRDTATHTDRDDDRLWEKFVMERSSKKGGKKQLSREKTPKSRLRKIVSRLFSRKQRWTATL